MENLPDKALSIRQPWAWAIVHSTKRVENRPRRFHYRGPICIHASLTHTIKAQIEAESFMDSIGAQIPPSELAESLKSSEMIERGGIIGTAEIVDCIDTSDDPWFFGPYGLVLDNIKEVGFIPVKGSLGLFDWKKKLTH